MATRLAGQRERASEQAVRARRAAAEPVVAVPSRARGLHRVSVAVLVVGLLITASLSWGARSLRDRNEDRLLRQRVHEAAAVATAAMASLRTPLSAAVALASTTGADTRAFVDLMTPIVASGQPFVSASMWPTDTTDPHPLVVVGAPPEIDRLPPPEVQRFLARATRAPELAVNDLLARQQRRLGYGLADPDANLVVYAEAALPEDRPAQIASDAAFSDLDYALYLGDSPDPERLLASSARGGALGDRRRASEAIPFGDSELFLVMAPRGELGGLLLLRLPWMLLGLGVVLSGAAALLVERLVRRRLHAEELATRLEAVANENAHLYTAQREIARTLQQSLLPERLPGVPGVDAAARYEPGVEGTDVGGDWYDVFPIGDRRLLVSVGDVGGRGLGAAAAMASLRYSIRAYAAQGDAPEAILDKVTTLMDVGRDGRFATVICGVLDSERREITVARAGHLDLLLVDSDGPRFLETPAGVPIGVEQDVPYRASTFPLPEHGTLLAFTDGLVERRGEHLDLGLSRLSASASAPAASLAELVDRIVDDLAPAGSDDDIALLGVRWNWSASSESAAATEAP